MLKLQVAYNIDYNKLQQLSTSNEDFVDTSGCGCAAGCKHAAAGRQLRSVGSGVCAARLKHVSGNKQDLQPVHHQNQAVSWRRTDAVHALVLVGRHRLGHHAKVVHRSLLHGCRRVQRAGCAQLSVADCAHAALARRIPQHLAVFVPDGCRRLQTDHVSARHSAHVAQPRRHRLRGALALRALHSGPGYLFTHPGVLVGCAWAPSTCILAPNAYPIDDSCAYACTGLACQSNMTVPPR